MDTNRITRRRLLAGAGALTASAATYRPRFACAFYIWTQQFAREKKTLADGVEEALAATRRAGYSRVELMSVFLRPEVREKTLAGLKANRLELASVYHGGPMHIAAEAGKTIADTLEFAEIARAAGARMMVANPNPKPKKERKTDEELAVQARQVNQLAERLRERGLGLALHHHDPEMAENAREWRHLRDNTDPKLVRFCIDTDWVRRGGQDVLGILREAAPRLASLHLRNTKQGVWTEDFGNGDIDYGAVAAYLKSIGFQGLLIVELAMEKETRITRSLEENLRESRTYAERIFGR